MLAVFTVTNLDDASVAGTGDAPGTLRQAVFDANHSAGVDSIQFAPGLSGVIELSVVGDTGAGPSALLVTSPITIQGNASGITIGRDASAGEMRLFHIHAGGSLTLESLNLTGGIARGEPGASGGNGGHGRGGAIFNQGAVQIVASTLYGNQAIGGDADSGGRGGQGLGGAVFSEHGTIELQNATLSGNSALGGAGSPAGPGFGGAVYGINGTVTIHNSTVTSSTATTGRGLYVLADGGETVNVEIFSSIIAQADTSSFSPDVVVSFDTNGQILVSAGNNLIRAQVGLPPGSGSNADPLLAPLADNGGPTLTHALLSGSPAIDQGVNPLNLSTDGRGPSYSRVVGGQADIGAFEIQSTVGPSLPGDYNGNDVVDAADYVVWRRMLGNVVDRFSGADGSGNELVDTADHNVWTQNFGAIPAPEVSASTTGTSSSISIDTSPNGEFATPNAFESFLAGHQAPTLPARGTPALRSSIDVPDQAHDKALLAFLADGPRRVVSRDDGSFARSNISSQAMPVDILGFTEVSNVLAFAWPRLS